MSDFNFDAHLLKLRQSFPSSHDQYHVNYDDYDSFMIDYCMGGIYDDYEIHKDIFHSLDYVQFVAAWERLLITCKENSFQLPCKEFCGDESAMLCDQIRRENGLAPMYTPYIDFK